MVSASLNLLVTQRINQREGEREHSNLTQNAQGLACELEPSSPALVAAAASRRPDPQPELCSEDEDGEGLLEVRADAAVSRTSEGGAQWTI